MALGENDLAFLQEILDTPDPPKVSKRKKPKDVRDIYNWFHNPLIIHNVSTGCCSQGDECLGKTIHGKGPERVTAIVNDVEMCRFCFLDGLAYRQDNE